MRKLCACSQCARPNSQTPKGRGIPKDFTSDEFSNPCRQNLLSKEFVHLANKVIEVFEKAAMEGHIEQLEKFEVIPVDEETYIVRKHLLMTEDEVDDILAGIHFGVAEQT